MTGAKKLVTTKQLSYTSRLILPPSQALPQLPDKQSGMFIWATAAPWSTRQIGQWQNSLAPHLLACPYMGERSHVRTHQLSAQTQYLSLKQITGPGTVQLSLCY